MGKHRLRTTLGAVVATALLAGCGGTAASAEKPKSSATPDTSAASAKRKAYAQVEADLRAVLGSVARSRLSFREKSDPGCMFGGELQTSKPLTESDLQRFVEQLEQRGWRIDHGAESHSSHDDQLTFITADDWQGGLSVGSYPRPLKTREGTFQGMAFFTFSSCPGKQIGPTVKPGASAAPASRRTRVQAEADARAALEGVEGSRLRITASGPGMGATCHVGVSLLTRTAMEREGFERAVRRMTERGWRIGKKEKKKSASEKWTFFDADGWSGELAVSSYNGHAAGEESFRGEISLILSSPGECL